MCLQSQYRTEAASTVGAASSPAMPAITTETHILENTDLSSPSLQPPVLTFPTVLVAWHDAAPFILYYEITGSPACLNIIPGAARQVPQASCTFFHFQTWTRAVSGKLCLSLGSDLRKSSHLSSE